jgi:hypothetical protein
MRRPVRTSHSPGRSGMDSPRPLATTSRKRTAEQRQCHIRGGTHEHPERDLSPCPTTSPGFRSLGLGTWFIDDDKAAEAVKFGDRDWLPQHRYRTGLRQRARRRSRRSATAGIPREKLFISTKIAAEIKDYDQARSPRSKSRWRRCSTSDHIDLMLIHAPQPWDDFRTGDYAEEQPRGVARPRRSSQGRERSAPSASPTSWSSDLENILQNADGRSAREPDPRPRRQHPE